MKAINKIWVFALGTAVMVSCSDLDTFPESGIVTEDQKKEVVEDNPERLRVLPPASGKPAAPAFSVPTDAHGDPLYDSSRLDDGKLRILYGYDNSGGACTVLCGSKGAVPVLPQREREPSAGHRDR